MIRKPSEMRTEVRKNMRGAPGSVTIQHYFAKEDIEADVRLCARLVIPPGAGIGSHQHEKEDEIFIIQKGTGLIDDNGTQVRVSPGDAILTGKGGSHAVLNDGDADLEITAMIMCY